MTIRVVLADDQEMVRIGFAMILGAVPDMQVVGQAADGVEAVGVIAETRPDVVLLDIRMPRLDGIEVCRRVAESSTRVVIVTTFGEPDYVDAALGAGQTGYHRVRMGVGRPSPENPATARLSPADYVLQPFTDDELRGLEPLFGRAAQAVELIIRGNAREAMNRFNAPGPGEKPASEKEK